MHRPIRHVCAPLLPLRFACSAPRRMPADALISATSNAGIGHLKHALSAASPQLRQIHYH